MSSSDSQSGFKLAFPSPLRLFLQLVPGRSPGVNYRSPPSLLGHLRGTNLNRLPLSSSVPLLVFRFKFNWRCLVLSFGGQLSGASHRGWNLASGLPHNLESFGDAPEMNTQIIEDGESIWPRNLLHLGCFSPPLIYQWIELALRAFSFVLRMFDSNFIISQINVWTVQELYFKHIISGN